MFMLYGLGIHSIERYLLLIAATACTASAGLVAAFAYAPQIIAMHLLVLVFTGVLFFGLLVAINYIIPAGKLRLYVITILLSAIFLYWFSFVLLNYVSNFLWNSFFSYTVFIPLISTVLKVIRNEPGLLLALLASGGGFVSAVIMAHYYFSQLLEKKLIFIFSWARQSRRQTFSLAILTVLFCSFIGFFIYNSFNPHNPGIWRGEPLLGSWAKNSGGHYKDSPKKIRQLSKKARKNYPTLTLKENSPNIIIIMIDSIRADHTPMYGYQRNTMPFLDRLYREGKLQIAQQAFSSCSESNCGILSTLNSKEFRNIQLQNFKLQEVLKRVGYQSHFVLSGEHDWYDLKENYGNSMDSILDSGAGSELADADDNLIFEATEKITLTSQPAFFFFHLMSAHVHGVKHDDYAPYQPSGIAYTWNEWAGGKVPDEKMLNFYDNGIFQADAYVKKIVDYLQKNSLLDNSLIIILGDHGEGLGEHGNYSHTKDLYQESIAIPLMIIDSHQQKFPSLSHALQIDVAPTILNYLKLPIPSTWQGRSLMRPKAERLSYHQTLRNKGYFASIYYDGDTTYKYLVHGRSNNIFEKQSLFNLDNDPLEKNNLYNTESIKTKDLIKKMKTGFNNSLLQQDTTL
jgi:arylsulfatase A-like enzyme